jgi:hypothetical protein
MALTLTYDPQLSRVRITADDLGGLLDAADHATVDRSTDGVTWTAVRGGLDVPLTPELTLALDDYEFPPNEPVTYRVRSFTGSGGQVEQFTAQITANLDSIWLKSIIRPFLNRPITVTGWSDVTRPARNGVFGVVGRSVPVVVTDLRGSRRFTLEVMTQTLDQAREFDLILASGDPVFLHMPPDCPVPGASGHYAVIGDTTMSRRSTRGTRRYFSLPLIESAPPAADVVGATVTWQAITADFATWTDVLAEFPTWADVLEYIADPADVIVP